MEDEVTTMIVQTNKEFLVGRRMVWKRSGASLLEKNPAFLVAIRPIQHLDMKPIHYGPTIPDGLEYSNTGACSEYSGQSGVKGISNDKYECGAAALKNFPSSPKADGCNGLPRVRRSLDKQSILVWSVVAARGTSWTRGLASTRGFEKFRFMKTGQNSLWR